MGILLSLTSNSSAVPVQSFNNVQGKKLFEHIVELAQQWGTPDNIMFVVGATQSGHIATIRKLVPEHFFLVPGIGAQGGDLKTVIENGSNSKGGLIINSSRGIIFDPNPQLAAATLQLQIKEIWQPRTM